MAWKFESGLSLAEQIADRIRTDIINGVYKSSEPFPTVRQLAFDASVNPNTMQKALCVIEDEGLLVTLSTQGRIVTEDTELIDKARNVYKKKQLGSFIARAKELSITKEEFIEYIEKGWNENE